MSRDWYLDIVNFHKEVMEEPVETVPRKPQIGVITLRETLIKEEIKETLEAIYGGTLEDVADGIVDSIVVLIDTAISFGIDIRPVWDEVHKTNMAKRGGPLREDGKRLKPAGWEPPKIKEIIEKQKKKKVVPATYSKYTKGLLFVACVECERGHNGTKYWCSFGHKFTTHEEGNGCYIGELLENLEVRK